VASIGSRIDEIVAEKVAQGYDGAKWRKHCWVFASFFWPRQGVSYTKLMDIYAKLVSTKQSVLVADQQGEKTKVDSPAPTKPKAKRKGDAGEGSSKKKVKMELD